MGCSESKSEEQRAVALCRGRVELLAAAIRHRDALAASHAAYSDSLLSVSAALHRVLLLVPASSPSPLLPLPARRKTAPSPPLPLGVSSVRFSRPSCHLKFTSSDFDCDDDGDDGDDEEEDEDSPCPSPSISPAHHLRHYGTIPGGTGYGNIYYARSQPPPSSVSVQVCSFNAHTAAYPSYGYPYGAAAYPGYYGSTGGFFAPSSTLPAIAESALGGSSSSGAPPPPPSPPNTSTWDFLNPFNTYNNYCHHYSPSRSSREVRDEEGIPDLEEIDQDEEERDAYGDTNRGTSSSTGDSSYYHRQRPVAADRRSSKVEPEATDNNTRTAGELKRTQIKQRNASEVADTINIQFQKASQCFAELSVLLEAENYWYHQPTHSPSDDGYKVMDSRGLASTLQKLYVWERKLHHEVRAEEKMRLLLRKSHNELKHLLKNGAEENKIESTRTLIDKLSTEIRIAIRVVSSVSRRINLLRDEELLPRIAELVFGLSSLWNAMLECHRVQYRLITEAVRLDLVIAGGYADEIMQLEMEVHKWSCNFSSCLNAQRNCVRALNGWLLLCLHREPGAAASDASPRRLGAPPVFVLCNSWSRAICRTSETAALDAMQDFAAALHRLWRQRVIEQSEPAAAAAAAVRDRDRRLRAMEKKMKDMHREAHSLNKKLAVVPAVLRPPTAPMFVGRRAAAGELGSGGTSLQFGLEKIFEAMEVFSASSVKAFQELLDN